MVNGRYIMSPSPIPRWDISRLHRAESLTLLGAGREKRVYAVPPHTEVAPLEFQDIPFAPESFAGLACARCGSRGTYLDEIYDEASGEKLHVCSDSGYCDLAGSGAVPRKEARHG
jgi:alpha-D-ribose 1-methylphosphonate 5-phosphate C-P lyase